MVSMKYDDDLPARVKEQADIVQVIGQVVELKKAGIRYLGCCPFHNEKTPSFSVHPGEQFYHCFGCGAHGDIIDFQMKYNNLDFPSALKGLADRLNIAIPEQTLSPARQKQMQQRKEMFALNEKIAVIWQDCLRESQHAAKARAYLEKRGIGPAVQKSYGIGYAPGPDSGGWNFLGGRLSEDEQRTAIDLGLLVRREKGGTYDRFRDRVLFPIYDRSGKVHGFGGRIVGEGQPKYMNSPESPVFNKSNSLLGIYQHGDDIRRRNQAIIVEGNFDLVSLAVNGFANVVAPLGTALTMHQIRMLKSYAEEGVLLFDGDTAGIKAVMRAVPLFLSEEFAGRVALLPGGHDPDTFVREEGRAALENLLAQAQPLPEFSLGHLVEKHGLTLDGKNRIARDLQPLIGAARSPLQRKLLLAHFSSALGISPSELSSALVVKEQPVSPAVASVSRKSAVRVPPLTGPQKRLLTHVVLYPDSVGRFEAHRLRACLEGTIGEVLLLHLENMLRECEDLTAEDLLNGLPGGAERQFVSDVLLQAGAGSVGISCRGTEGEIIELLGWLERDGLLHKSNDLMERIVLSESRQNHELRDQLLLEKIKVDKQLQELRQRNTFCEK